MNFEMQKAILLAEQINGFIKYVYTSYENNNSFRFNRDKLYQIKLLIEEFKFQILADELLRINQFDWDEKYTYFLVDRFKEGITTIDEFVQNNDSELFLLTAKLYTLNNLCLSFNRKE